MKRNLRILKYIALVVLLVWPSVGALAQIYGTDTIKNPSVLYSAPKRYEIASCSFG